MAENTQKTAEKNPKNRCNPCGAGIVRFNVALIIQTSTEPITITQITNRICEKSFPVSRMLVARIIEEIKITGLAGQLLQSKIIHVGRSRASAYFLKNQNQ